MEKKIEEWFERHFKHHVIIHNTEVWNVCHAAKEDLKKILIPGTEETIEKKGDK
jgi:hypothetical protein